MGLINNNANSEFLYKSSQLITLIQRDDGKKKQTMAQKARLSCTDESDLHKAPLSPQSQQSFQDT